MQLAIFENLYRQQIVNPAVTTTATLPASFISMEDFQAGSFVMELGATGDVVDMKVVQATDAAGTGVKDITGALITQLSGTDDNKQASVTFDEAQLDINNGFTHVAVTLTIAGVTTLGCVFYGIKKGESPVTQIAAFTEQVNVLG